MDEPARKRRKTSSPGPSSPPRQLERRPSFASPTKASLARDYPSLLPPQSPALDQLRTRGKQARAFVFGTASVQQEPTQRARGATPPQHTENGIRQLVGEDADLPLTPSQIGLEAQDEPRRGILFSSPSKRPPRVKDATKQSLLQPNISAVVQPTQVGHEDIQNATVRKGQPSDPELQKRKHEKARLEHELAELEAQVLRCTKEISKEQQRGVDDTFTPSERTEMIDFISKLTGADTLEEQPVLVSSLLNSFLPFSSLVVPQPRRKLQEKPVPSHRPLELDDPLPYLSMFTSFTFSTQLNLPRTKISPSSNRVHQKHTIEIVGPQKLLTAQASVIVDAVANEVIDMNIIRLSPWAERELGVFIRSRAKEKDIGNACWAIDSFWTIARKRAQYWHRCSSAFAHLIPGHKNDTENPASPKPTIARRDLTRHLGRDVLILQDKDVLLKLNWRIGFDWTGEAESNISVEQAVPRVWQEADAAASFQKIPDVFASLLHSRGAFDATRILVAMLFART